MDRHPDIGICMRGVLPRKFAYNAHGAETMALAFSALVMTEVRLGVVMVPSNKK